MNCPLHAPPACWACLPATERESTAPWPTHRRKSRKRFKKRKLFESFEPEALPGYSSAGGYASAEPDYASAGYGGPRGGEGGGHTPVGLCVPLVWVWAIACTG